MGHPAHADPRLPIALVPHGGAEKIAAEDRPVFIYYFGDYDPSGLDIARNVEERIYEFAPSADVHFERSAVTLEQIQELNLPTRPTKRTDSRSTGWIGGSVELDAIPSNVLRDMVEEKILLHVNEHQLDVILAAEESETAMLRRIFDREFA